MEKSISIKEEIKCKFNLKEVDIRTYSPLALAYIGDGIYDLIIRTIVVGRGNTRANTLHHRTSRLVNAVAQAKMAALLEPEWTPQERAVFRRGRNAKPHTMAKHATIMEYKNATGFEAVLGYLYLDNQMERLLELTALALERFEASAIMGSLGTPAGVGSVAGEQETDAERGVFVNIAAIEETEGKEAVDTQSKQEKENFGRSAEGGENREGNEDAI